VKRKARPLRLAHFTPLAGFVVPTVVIGYGFVIPRSCIAGWNELTIGFAATVLGACLTYWAGLRLVISAGEKRDGEV
jgi:ABC-type Fe3+ transport system permease subunit